VNTFFLYIGCGGSKKGDARMNSPARGIGEG
jgi:hypothetical protein